MAWVRVGENFLFIRFDTIHERDGRTHRHRMTAKAMLDASNMRQKQKQY